jgi:aminoglycoside phosphotransferase (APT) family kinase protein
MTDKEFISRLHAAVARHIGAPGAIHELRRLTGGANKTTWSFDAEVKDGRRRFILQLSSVREPDPQDPMAAIAAVAPHLSADEDARLMIAAVKAGVPAPRVRAILDSNDGLGAGYVTEFVPGETLGPRVVRDDALVGARAMMARQCGEILAAIHRVDPADVPFLKRQHAAEMVAAQRMIVDHLGFRLPALELGLRWAAENAPRDSRHTVVHGDFRTGNLIVGPEGVRCVLDWEIAQSGDPMQDLGWLCVKTWRFGGARPVGGFGAREDLFAAYERAGGHRVDPAHVRFWEAFGSVKWAIGCLRMATRGAEEGSLERCAIGRRIEEPLWDFLNLIEGRD